MSGVVVLSVGAPSYSRFMSGVEKISSTLSIIADEAVYSGDAISCNLTSSTIECKHYQDGEWVPLPIRKLVSWGWPKELKILKVIVNGIPLKDKEPLRFFSSGDNASLSIEIGDGTFTAWIDSDLTGRYKVSN